MLVGAISTPFFWNKTMLLVELTGPSLTAHLPGWLLKIEDQEIKKWKSNSVTTLEFKKNITNSIKKVYPQYDCINYNNLLDLCVNLTRQLTKPINLECIPLRNPKCPQEPLRQILIRSQYHTLAGEAINFAINILQEASPLTPTRPDDSGYLYLRRAVKQIQRRARLITSHSFTNAVIEEARQRGLLLEILHERPGFYPLLQIGSGEKSRLVSSTSLDSDCSIGQRLCGNKAYSQQILRRLGYPVPRHIQISKHFSRLDLVNAVRIIGYPCVMKPMDAELGAGVSINIRDEAALLRAAEYAQEYARSGLLLEEHVPGDYHRLVVLEGSLVRVGRFQPPHLLGDGKRSIQAILNDPNSKNSQLGAVLSNGPTPTLNEQMLVELKDQGWTPDGVPAKGEQVILRCNLRDRDDWICESIMNNVDNSLHRLASGVAKSLGMANVGIDVLSPDITQPAISRKLWVIEVNAMQRMHPGMASTFVDAIFTDTNPAQIPVSIMVFADKSYWQNLSELNPILNHHKGYSLALPERLALQMDLQMRINIEKNHAIYTYHHPREVLMNRCVQAVLFLIDWHELMQSGLPSPWTNQLQLLGKPPQGMDKPWQRLLHWVKPQTENYAKCSVPTWSFERY